MPDYYVIPTNIGEAKMANALALGIPLAITELALGDGEGTGARGTPVPNPEATGLVSERRRAPVNSFSVDPDNLNVLIAEQVIPETEGGWWIREMGLFDEDGDLIFVCNTPPTYKPQLSEGSGRTQVVRMASIVSDTAAVTLKVDPSVVIATKEYVQDVIDVQSLEFDAKIQEIKDANGTAASKDVGRSPDQIYLNDDHDSTPTRSYLGNIRAAFGSNLSVFTAQQIESFNGSQYTAYWRTNDEVLVIAKRALPNGDWQQYAFDGLSGRDLITIDQLDNHWNCSIGLDKNGRMVICYNTRNSVITWRYATNLEDITAWSAAQTGMTGNSEASATYPTFFYGPDYELLFMYREGSSGNGVCNINAWDPAALTWSIRQHPVITGTDTTPVTSPYWWTPPITQDGTIHLFWCWRELSGGVQGNFNMNYARSVDGGVTWKKSDGTAYALPITQATAEVAAAIPQGNNFINQGHAAEDENGDPVVAYQKDNASTGVPQLFVTRLENGVWVDEQVTDRYVDYQLSDTGNPGVPQARPGVLVYPGNRLVVIARDWELGGGMAFYIKQSGRWVMRGPVTDNLNSWEPQWDRRRFLNDGALDILVGQISARDETPEWEYQTPLEVWGFNNLSSIPKSRTGRVKTVATMGGSGLPVDVSSAAFVTSGISLAFSRPAFDLYPTMARYIVRIENTVDTGDIEAALRLVRTRLDAGESEIITFSRRGWTPTAVGAEVILDSGWRQLPNVGGTPLDVGFIDIQLLADTGTVRLSAATLMLGAKVDCVDLPIVPII